MVVPATARARAIGLPCGLPPLAALCGLCGFQLLDLGGAVLQQEGLAEEEEEEEQPQPQSIHPSLLDVAGTMAGAARGCATQQTQFQGDFGTRTWLPLTLEEKRYTVIEPSVPPPKKPPLLALLLLTYKEVPNAEMWTAWMDQAIVSRTPFYLFIHAHGLKDNEMFAQERFQPFWIKKWFRTRWCDLRLPVVHMMKEALKDPDVTHVTLVSENSVPLKTLHHIYGDLQRDRSSRFCMDLNSGPRSPRAESWWLINREDAQVLADHQHLVLREFTDKAACADEEAWLRLLLLRKTKWKEQVQLRDECVMFTDWSGSCKEWKDHVRLVARDSLMAERHDTSSPRHPTTWHFIGNKSWADLSKGSPFWFGRKFNNGSFHTISHPYDGL